MGWGESITADEGPVVAEPLPDSIIVQDGQDDGSLANPTGPD